MEIGAMVSKLHSFTNVDRQQVVFYGDDCIATLELKIHPQGRNKVYQLASSKEKVLRNASFKKFDLVLWKDRNLELCRIEIILQLIAKNNLWPLLGLNVS